MVEMVSLVSSSSLKYTLVAFNNIVSCSLS